MKDKCILCGSELNETPLISYNNMPASAQNMPAHDELEDDKGIVLNLHQCKKCGLVQFACKPVAYYKEVIRAGGFTSTMVNLRREQYKRFIDYFGLENKKIVEVGCGRGEFLSILSEFDVKGYGVEESKALVDIAREQDLNVVQGFVGNENDRIKEGLFDAFLSFNFLEHQPDPNGMIQGIYNNLSDDGVGLITVPSLEYIIENNSFYEFIHDHIAYYSKETLEFLVEKNGFEVVSTRMINRDTWEVMVQKRKAIDIESLIKSHDFLKTQIHNYIDGFLEKNQKVAIWGASHQGFTIISMLDIGSKLSYIIDSAPFKQGKYSPGTHVPIVSPDYYFQESVDAIIIIAPGYAEEISSIIKQRYNSEVNVAVLKSKELEML